MTKGVKPELKERVALDGLAEGVGEGNVWVDDSWMMVLVDELFDAVGVSK